MKTSELVINKTIDEKFLRNAFKQLQFYLDEHHLSSVIIGISGGVDSSLCLYLLNKYLSSKQIFAYFIDIYSDGNDYDDAQKIASFCDCKCNYINLNETFDCLKKTLNEKNEVGLANLKARLRMLTLYNFAAKNNGLVIANTNLDELYLGYFTKFGDGAGDYFPLACFLKRDIYYLASRFHLPINILNKKPSSGLYDNKLDDEKQLDLKYENIDKYLALEDVDQTSIQKIDALHQKNKHKLIYNIYNTSKLKYRKYNEKK